MADPENLQDRQHSSPPSTKPISTTPRTHILAALALFLLGLLLAASFLHLALPDALHLHADMRSEKLVMLDRLHGHVFSAAFGTSRVHNGFDPRAFDQALDPTLHTHTLNLGIEGGSQAEQRVMALQFLHQLTPPPPGTSCLILLELNAGANFQPTYLVHPRTINVYDLQTERFVSHLVTPELSFTQRLGRIGFATAATFLHYLNIGMLSNRIFAPPLDQTLLADELNDDKRGIKIDPFSPGQAAYLQQRLAHIPARPTVQPGPLAQGNQDLIAELAAASPVQNLAFAYFMLPRIDDLYDTEAYPDHLTAAGRDIPILDLARPDRFPQLYQPSLFHDEGHLNGSGAALASQLLAQQLKTWYATHGAPAPCEALPSGSLKSRSTS